MRVLKPTTPRKVNPLGSGSYQRRHVGLYYWCNYWAMWDKVLDVGELFVTVVECDVNGKPVGQPRQHCTSPDFAMFADKPFLITRD